MKEKYKFIIGIIVIILSFSGCKDKMPEEIGNLIQTEQMIAGKWEMNLNLKAVRNNNQSEILRIETLPIQIVIQVENGKIYILPAPYLKEGFTGKGDIDLNTGMVHFIATSFSSPIFSNQVKMDALDLKFEYTGELSPEKNYITGDLRGNLMLMTKEGNIPYNISEGNFTIIKKIDKP